MARSVVVTAALLLSSCATWASTGSVYREPCLHIGVRPASDAVGDYAVTVQVTTDARALLGPGCRR
jgi:hypothetical protein